MTKGSESVGTERYPYGVRIIYPVACEGAAVSTGAGRKVRVFGLPFFPDVPGGDGDHPDGLRKTAAPVRSGQGNTGRAKNPGYRAGLRL